MTNLNAFKTSLAILASAFNRDMPDIQITAYWLALQTLTEEEWKTATARALADCKFMPVPSELLTFAGRSRGLATEIAEAWGAVRHAIDRYDYTVSVDFGSLVNGVVRNLGGWEALCRSDMKDLDVWTRKKFEELYAAFIASPPVALDGSPLRGAFGGVPVPIPIGGRMPPRQLEERRSNATVVARTLADEKNAR